MKNDMIAVIPAAGEGKRMKPLGINGSKIMIPVLGKPFLAYVLQQVADANLKRAIIVISKTSGQQIKKYFGYTYKSVTLSYVYQDKQLGTAHAIAQALPHIQSEYFLVQWSDSLAAENI